MIPEIPPFQGGQRLLRASLAAAAFGAVGLVIGAIVDPRGFFEAYLIAYAYAVSVAVGALVFLMICHAMRAGWPVVLRRLVEAMTATLPLLGVLFVPLLFGLHRLYPWVRPEAIHDEAARALTLKKIPYLNTPFFAVRAAVYLAVWIAVGELLLRWSRRGGADFDTRPRLQALSAGALPAVAITLSFASFDWLMSLTPWWFSTMFPVYYFAGGFLAALALLTILTWAAERAGALPWATTSHYYALGRLLLSFTIFWAYAAFFQFMLVWIGNKPDEVSFYVARSHGVWLAVSGVLIAGHFVLPFFPLLNYRLKRLSGPLAAIAGWLLAAHYLDVHWLVAPSLRQGRAPFQWLDLAALLAIGGATVAFALFRLRGTPIVPVHDPDLRRSKRYESS